jgi:hypothetical protein
MKSSLVIGLLGLILTRWVDGGRSHVNTDPRVDLTLVQSAIAKGASKYTSLRNHASQRVLQDFISLNELGNKRGMHANGIMYMGI